MIKLKSFAAGLILAVLSLGSAFGQQAGQLGSGQMWANPTASASRGRATSASSYFDFVYGSTRGSILERGASGWTAVVPNATAGLPWISNGTGADPSYATIGGAAFGTQSANRIFAGPTSGGAVNPTFRALVGADLPAQNAWTITMNNTSGSAAPTGTTVDGLTLKASPVASDEVLIWDTAGAAMKKATVTGLLSGGGVGSFNTLTGAVTFLTEPQGRLTLVANTPVMTSSQSAITTLRYDCYIGNQIPYYTGSADAYDTITSCEVTDAMVSAASAGQVVSGQVYDVWWVHAGTNRICLAMSSAAGGGGGWASDTGGSNTARGTGYSQLDRATRPYTTNKNSITNCFNAATNYGPVSANQGTYLGTVYASANGQISYNFGASASGGTAALFGVWNMYNRVMTPGVVTDSGTFYSYTTATIRQTRASAGNQVQFVTGLAEDAIDVKYAARIQTTAASGAYGAWGIGLDSTSTFACQQSYGQNAAAVATYYANTAGCLLGAQTGFHTISSNELGDGVNANLFDFGGANNLMLAIRN